MLEPGEDREIEESEGHERGIQEALGQSEPFLTFQEDLSRAAGVDRPVLIIGERGTGKELAATRLHYLSKRWQEAFVTLNCSALSPTLIESELFGHEAGAFTGATRRRTGRFEAAQGGTLFLDEIGMIPLETQEKILRAVEYGTFERVGSSQPIHVDARIIGATNADLRELAAQGRFKEDLMDRLSFEVLFLPPLKSRVEDILLLANHFAARMAFDLGWPQLPEITERAAEKLEGYDWPGNVRELKNVIERAVYRSDDALITYEEILFDPFESPYGPLRASPVPETEDVAEGEALERAAVSPEVKPDGRPFEEQVWDFELGLLQRALERAKFNQRQAAESLGLTYHQFRGLYRKYGKSLRE
jgi:psp operon transcriptional activator